MIFLRQIVPQLSLLIIIALAIFTCAKDTVDFFTNTVFFHNFHEVVAGRAYRSGRLPANELEEVIRRHHIGTVIDLRHGWDKEYEDGRTEGDLVRGLGRKYRHVSLGSSKPVTRDKLDKLLEIFAEADGPILIHCTQGIHRTGVATALWMLNDGHSLKDSLSMLGLKYGYLQFVQDLKRIQHGQKTVDDVLWDYEDAQDIAFNKWANSYHHQGELSLPTLDSQLALASR